MAGKVRVLRLYHRILKIAQEWKAQDPSSTATERDYIRSEAQSLFKKNKEITNEEEIEQHIQEAEARIDLAVHYNNPFPRPLNIPTNVLPPTRRKLKHREKQMKQSIPIYMNSYKKNL